MIPGARWDTYYDGVTRNGPLTTGEGERQPFNRSSSSSSLSLASSRFPPSPRLASYPHPLQYRPGRRRSLQLGLSGHYRYKWSSSVKPVSLIRPVKTRVLHRSLLKCVRSNISVPRFPSRVEDFVASLSLSLSLPSSLFPSYFTSLSLFLTLAIYRIFNLVTVSLSLLYLLASSSPLQPVSFLPISLCPIIPLSYFFPFHFFFHLSRETRRQTPQRLRRCKVSQLGMDASG